MKASASVEMPLLDSDSRPLCPHIVKVKAIKLCQCYIPCSYSVFEGSIFTIFTKPLPFVEILPLK